MRGNKVKQKLNADEVAVVVGGHSVTSDTIDFCGSLGFDGFWIEGEHGSVTWERFGDLSRACDLWNITSVTRIHSHAPGVIIRTLDCGVNGLVIPHVNTKEAAEQIVKAARFAPLGQRGMYSGRRSYAQLNFLEQANDEVLLVILIEEVQAVENLAEILTVDHIDVFFVAPSDLAQSMGYFGQPGHPEVQAVINRSLRQITEAGRVAGAMGSEDNLAQYIELGTRFFLINFDSWIQTGAQAYLAKVDYVKGGGGGWVGSPSVPS